MNLLNNILQILSLLTIIIHRCASNLHLAVFQRISKHTIDRSLYHFIGWLMRKTSDRIEFASRAKIRMRVVREAADAGCTGKKLGASRGDHYDIAAFSE